MATNNTKTNLAGDEGFCWMNKPFAERFPPVDTPFHAGRVCISFKFDVKNMFALLCRRSIDLLLLTNITFGQFYIVFAPQGGSSILCEKIFLAI